MLRLIEHMLKAGCIAEGKRLETEQGMPQGGVVSPLLSNILLTPFDCEMRRRGYRLTRYADDWVVMCRTWIEAQYALAEAKKILMVLGVTLNEEKTHIVHVAPARVISTRIRARNQSGTSRSKSELAIGERRRSVPGS